MLLLWLQGWFEANSAAGSVSWLLMPERVITVLWSRREVREKVVCESSAMAEYAAHGLWYIRALEGCARPEEDCLPLALLL
jgi:hypothetical protein